MSQTIATRYGPPTTGRQDAPAPDAEADAAAIAVEDGWRDWIDDLRFSIEQGGGDSEDDPDSLLIGVLQYVADEIEASAKSAEERASKYARSVLRLAEDANHKIAIVTRQQREAKEERTAEALALAQRLDRVDTAIDAMRQENIELRAKLDAINKDLNRATELLTKEIARERSLRRLIDARHNRPHDQRLASGLAKTFAAKVLEAAVKAKPEAATKVEAA